MSLFLDQKYLLLISNRLPNFKKKNDALYNCRCVICGDSVKKRNKARGYFFSFKNELRYKCHNCDASMTFGTFLKTQDNNLYDQYVMEKYTEGGFRRANTTVPFNIEFKQPEFQNNILNEVCVKLTSLPSDHAALQYCHSRRIPQDKIEELYFVDNISKLERLSEKYKDKIIGNEPRIVIPYYNTNNTLIGVTCRSITDHRLKYVTIKITDEPFIYGLNNVNSNEHIYVVEGPIDSFFIKNSIAISGLSFAAIRNIPLPKEKIIVVIDNQPRNKQVCDIAEKIIESGFRIIIWPSDIIQKDINEIVMEGHNINEILKNNNFSGLEAAAKFSFWKKC